MLGVDLPALAIVGVKVAAPPAREFYSALTQSAGVQRADIGIIAATGRLVTPLSLPSEMFSTSMVGKPLVRVQVNVTKTRGTIAVPDGDQMIGMVSPVPKTLLLDGEITLNPSGNATLEFGALVPLVRLNDTVNNVLASSKSKLARYRY